MALLLQLWGYESTVVYEGKRAIELAAALRPNVVFLDIGLPDMDGCEVARHLRQMPETSKAHLIAVTGYGMEADIQRCKRAGINLHFLKPADPEIIRMVLELESKRDSRGGELLLLNMVNAPFGRWLGS
jgi:CheY-like chemotaxis protein